MSDKTDENAARAPPLRFRFKTRDAGTDDGKDGVGRSRKRRHHHHGRRHRRQHDDDDDDNSDGSDHRRRKQRAPVAGNSSSAHDQLDPDRAFRESLFDALGDDEGADFWQSVYGQPIHTYGNTVRNEDTGCLEHMDDDEYAQFVRRKMWERSREGIEELREQRRRRREQERADEKRAEEGQRHSTRHDDDDDDDAARAHSNWAFDFEIEASLRRGRRRRDDKRWQRLWAEYLQRWQDLRALVDGNSNEQSPNSDNKLALGREIAWPVESGKRTDVQADKIETFFTRAAAAAAAAAAGSSDTDDKEQDRASLLPAILKQERVRWHPDKMQQRYGGCMHIDEPTMQGITATFQVLDRMWNEARSR